MLLPPALARELSILRRAYPDEVPDEDYRALLVVLWPDFSDRNLAAVVAELVGGEPALVAHDATAAVAGQVRPLARDIERVRERLASAGYVADDEVTGEPEE
ncbi:DUF3349 domain-containing protein [Micromonospora sp. RHAY321]|uniref:DUF3349 domain-containing protein n=1 Tax=Micromonospora sp. RHAY321 TaxID=2944807 RepID=UPI00207C94AB|nr:DUF3349 domain-containing protein [Micromonospora sp. RHAY321]MCO1595692.1 DUF3349 domain-containing protein [Micromonospora sp. RHAY321]